MTGSAIEIADLAVVRGRRKLLSIDRLDVAAGEVLGVLGPNGAGKSTLLKCLVGAIRPTSGSVRVLDEAVGRLSAVALTRLRRRVAYLAQVLAPGSEMPLTLREVVAVGRTGRAGLGRRLSREDWRRIDQWIERLGMQPLARYPYSALSGGEQRKTLLAMALVQQPQLLLLDEPTANLDAYWREQMVTTLESVHRDSGLTIVLVCHDMEALPPNTDRVLILREGRVAAQGPCAEVLTQQRMEDLYGPGLAVLRQGQRYVLVPQSAEGRA